MSRAMPGAGPSLSANGAAAAAGSSTQAPSSASSLAGKDAADALVTSSPMAVAGRLSKMSAQPQGDRARLDVGDVAVGLRRLGREDVVDHAAPVEQVVG